MPSPLCVMIDVVAVRVLLVDRDPDPQRRLERQVRPAHQARQVIVAARLRDRIDRGARRLDAALVDRRGVHEGAIVVADLLVVTALRRIGWQGLHDAEHLLLCALVELAEGAPVRTVGRDLVAVEPTAIRVAVEVIPGAHGEVARVKVDAPRRDACRRAGRRRGRLGGRVRHDQHPGCAGSRHESIPHTKTPNSQWRHTPHANSSQPAIQASPPAGVSTPSARGAEKLKA